MNAPKIAYILQFFPYLTETFIYREVLALRETGLTIITVANRPPKAEDLPSDAAWLMNSTRYIFPLNLQKLALMLVAQVFFGLRYPRRYLRALAVLLSEKSKNPRIWLRNFMHFAGAAYLAWELRGENLSHLHAHFSTNAASLACFTAIFLEIPFSMTVHNEIFVERLLLPAKLRRAKFIACISYYSRQALIQDYPQIALSAKSPIVRCGIAPLNYQTKQHEILTILSAAQLVERKGTAYLLEACHLLKERGIAFRCIIAGDGEERPKLEAMVAKWGLSKVTFLGRYSQAAIGEIFAQADIFVLPCITSPNGDRDGIPVALMEAMAAGLPVISTTVSGIPELIQSDVDGLLVEEKNADALANAIAALFLDAALREKLRKAAQAKIDAEFSIQKSSQVLASLFKGTPLHD